MRTLTIFSSLLALSYLAVGRMATPHRRTTDVCANVDLDLNLVLVDINIQVCACVGQIGAVISGNPLIGAAVKTMGGVANLTATISTAIDHGSGKCSCVYPDYAIPACSKSNLCDFKCPNDCVKQDGHCNCKGGKYDCNGKCSPQPCSSQAPAPPCHTCTFLHLREEHGRDKRSRHHGTPNWARRSLSAAHCPRNTEMCGVLGHTDGWECVKTLEDLESCGGCAVPFFPGQTPGVDCSALPGIDSIGCVKGMCQVHKCSLGWTLSTDGHSCERNSTVTGRGLVSTGSGVNKSGGSSETDRYSYREW